MSISLAGQISLLIAFVGFLGLLLHMVLTRHDPTWEQAPQIPLHDDTPQTPFEDSDVEPHR